MRIISKFHQKMCDILAKVGEMDGLLQELTFTEPKPHFITECQKLVTVLKNWPNPFPSLFHQIPAAGLIPTVTELEEVQNESCSILFAKKHYYNVIY